MPVRPFSQYNEHGSRVGGLVVDKISSQVTGNIQKLGVAPGLYVNAGAETILLSFYIGV